MTHMVDERFELMALISRLAFGGRAYTEYHRKLDTQFAARKEHPAVKYARQFSDRTSPFIFAAHIEKDGDKFAFIDDLSIYLFRNCMVNGQPGEFLPLLNDFYSRVRFAEFFAAHEGFYTAETERFIEGPYSKIDFEWFRPYNDPENLRCVVSPSLHGEGFGPSTNGGIFYCVVPANMGRAIVHEFVHGFANPIAYRWYRENKTFKKWCDKSVSWKNMSYPAGIAMAGEYVTRAYDILYQADHGSPPAPALYIQKTRGFTYIEDVYAMITDYEKTTPGDFEISNYVLKSLLAGLGVDYELGEEQTCAVTVKSREETWRWREVKLSKPAPELQGVIPNRHGSVRNRRFIGGGVFGTKTGDVLLVNDRDLYIDLGRDSRSYGGETVRFYTFIPLTRLTAAQSSLIAAPLLVLIMLLNKIVLKIKYKKIFEDLLRS